MPPIAGIAVAAWLGLAAAPATGDRGYQLSLGEHAALTTPGVPGRLNVVRFGEGGAVTDGDIWFDGQRDGLRYLVLTLQSYSNPDYPDRQCGAGEEVDLVWLKVKPPYRVLDSQTFLITSCWHTVMPSASPESSGAPLEWRFDSYRDSVTRSYVVTLDRQAPERGLQAYYTFEP